MKRLPQPYFIKSQPDNPLWDKFIKWLNKKHKTLLKGNLSYAYGEIDNKIIDAFTPDDIDNKLLITLEEWDKVVNKEEFILPEKWVIKVTPENACMLTEWKIKKSDGKYHNPAHKYMFIDHLGGGYVFNHPPNPDFTEITLEEFKAYVLREQLPEEYIVKCENAEQTNICVTHMNTDGVKYPNSHNLLHWEYCIKYSTTPVKSLFRGRSVFSYIPEDLKHLPIYSFDKWKQLINNKMEKEIIGYKLVKPEYKSAVLELIKYIYTPGGADAYFDENLKTHGYHFPNSYQIYDHLKKAKVLDSWFKPVYKTEVYVFGIKAKITDIQVQFGCKDHIYTKDEIKRIIKSLEALNFADSIGKLIYQLKKTLI